MSLKNPQSATIYGGDRRAQILDARAIQHCFCLRLRFSAPYYFFKMWRRGNWRAGFFQRLGEYGSTIRQSITNRHIIWMHAVSVGEMNVCVQVIRALEPRMPNVKIVVSTTTTTGMGELQKRLPAHVGKIYYPIDRANTSSCASGHSSPCHRAGGIGNLAELHLARARARNTALPHQRAAVGPILSALQTASVFYSGRFSIVHRRRRAK